MATDASITPTTYIPHPMTMAEQWEMLFYYLTNDCKAGDCEECSNIIDPESYLSLKDSIMFSDVSI
jgi:hypothetical protein